MGKIKLKEIKRGTKYLISAFREDKTLDGFVFWVEYDSEKKVDVFHLRNLLTGTTPKQLNEEFDFILPSGK